MNSSIFLSKSRSYLSFVLATSLLIGGWLSYSTFYINHWPTDSQDPYIPTAARLFEKPWLSQMHTIPEPGPKQFHMRGKEVLILGIAVMQRIWNDYESLYPNVLLLIIATVISIICIYLIFHKIFGPETGLLISLIYIFSFWPYIYILQGAHQPLAFMNFLVAVLFFLHAEQKKFLSGILTGIFLGLLAFSSPTASIYLIYFLGLVLWREWPMGIKNKSTYIGLAIGFLTVFLIFTLPDPGASVRGFLQFVNENRDVRDDPIQLTSLPQGFLSGGLVWIWRYFILIMPVLIPAFLLCLMLTVKRSVAKPSLLLLIFLSLATPLAIDFSGAAQFGRNYFACFPGILLLIGYIFHTYRDQIFSRELSFRKTSLQTLIILALIGHIIFNVRIFLTDVFPSSMSTEYMYQWLIKHGPDKVYTYRRHPYNLNFAHFLNNPKHKEKIRLIGVTSLSEARDGYILVPPTTGKTIYVNCRYPYRDNRYVDLPFIVLSHSNDFQKFVGASFKTLASSKIWAQEEQTCTYLDLMLHDLTDEDRREGLAYLINARGLQEEWFPQLKSSGLLKEQPK